MILALMLVCGTAAFAQATASSSSIQFPGQTVGKTSAPISVTITNTTNSSTAFSSVFMSTAQFSYTGQAMPITLAPGQSFTASVTFTPSAVQAYSGTMTFFRRTGAPLISVALSGSGVAAVSSALTASPSALSFSAQVGAAAPAAQSLTISENPAGAVGFSVSADQSWISLSAASGTTSGAVKVSANISGLVAGNYSGHVIVSAAGVANSPMSIPVSLIVAAAQSSYVLVAAPNALAFSGAVGTSPACQTLTVDDTTPGGPLPVVLSSDSSWLTVTPASGHTKLAASVCVKATALAAGNFTGHIVVAATGPNNIGQTVNNSPFSIPVLFAVTAAPASLTAAPSALSFSAQVGAAAPAAQSLTIGKNPAGAVAFSVSADQAWISLSAASGTTPGAVQVSVNMSGLAAGSYSGHVIASAAGLTNSPMSIPVTIVVAAAAASPYSLTMSPASLAFIGAVASAPACQVLTVDDTTPGGPLPVVMNSDAAWLTVTPASGHTKLATSVCVKTTGLAAGNYTGHIVATATGPNNVGQTVNNSPMSMTVTLAITGAQTSSLTLNPTSVAFGNINLANNNTKSVTITNSGTGSVTISQINVVGLGISANGIATPTTLTAGQSTVLSIVYAPTLLGVVAGSVTVVSNATNSPAVILATGTGVQPQLASSPTSLNFGSVAAGANGTQTITLSNSGSAAVTISQGSVTGAGFSASGLTFPMTVAAGASVSFTVNFAPTAAGAVSGSVTVTSNTPNSPTLIALSGTGTAAVVHSVTLTWVASTSSTVVGYNVYRGSVSGGPYTMLNSTTSSGLSYTDMTVSSSQTYYYIVTAVDASGHESIGSNEVAVIIP